MSRAHTFFDRFIRRVALAGVLALATSALVAQAQVFSTPKNISNNTGDSIFPQIAVAPGRGDCLPGRPRIANTAATDLARPVHLPNRSFAVVVLPQDV